MGEVPAGDRRRYYIFGDLYALITQQRKIWADALVPPLPLTADDVTRLRGWLCFLGTIALLYRALPWVFGLLLLALILDSVDGAVARRDGLDCPQTDRAMDIFTEFMLCAAYWRIYPGWISTTLIILWVVPKSLWAVQYLIRRFGPKPARPGSGLGQSVWLSFVILQSFPFVHVLLILVFLQWTFRWNLP